MTIVHIVLFEWKPTTTHELVQEVSLSYIMSIQANLPPRLASVC
jgi:hypothetical protein